MKKGLIFAALVLVVAMFCGCGLTATKATVSVTVKNQLGITQANVPVYMYAEEEVEGIFPAEYSKKLTTEEDGVAVFELNLMDFPESLIGGEATFYFVVYNGNGDVDDYRAVTVKKGANKRIELVKH
ncbi:MAG: hypothetical protein II605_03650 [Paludibacteraceae bacterium]|nr:hypothetical protein [Paludibacteraceae bacterium]MBQ2189275.1 hypothetical protein [Paludibacteraceae bacterium]MBQ2520958.1 hypothetical protein [Paludibacteraceae bacterium]MBQ4018316.1 hypothetical protein [Paludibacteraceae bacterium]